MRVPHINFVGLRFYTAPLSRIFAMGSSCEFLVLSSHDIFGFKA